jgi:hypothetical protein
VIRALLGLVLAASGTAGSHTVLTIQDPGIDEASALVPLAGGLFATTNDSGDTGRVFVLDGSGATVGTTYWERDPTDTEALAPARTPGRLWVGDIGDNDAVRPTIQVAEIPVGRGTRTVAPTVYSLAYPDGPHDAETLLCDPASGRLYVATKALLGGELYAAPARLSATGVNRLRAVAPVLPLATDGAFFPDGSRVVIRSYPAAAVYRWPSMRRVGVFAMPAQPQGEGIGFDATGTLYASSEGRHSKVITVPVPARLAGGGHGGRQGGYGDAEAGAAPPSERPQEGEAAPVSPRSRRDAWLIAAAVLTVGVATWAARWRRRWRRRRR